MAITMGKAEREDRPWGGFAVLHEEAGFKVKRIEVTPGERISLQLHRHRSEHWFVVLGEGLATVGNRETAISPGDSLEIGRNVRHRIENTGDRPLVFIEVQCGEVLDEGDLVRFEDDYGRAT